MARTLFGGSGSGVGGSSVTPAISTTVVAGEAVAQGQIAVLGSDNLAYFAMEQSLASAALRPIWNPAPIVNGPVLPVTTVAANATNGSSNPTMAGCVLNSGNYVLAWQNATNIQFGVYSSGGVLQGSIQTVAPIGSNTSLYATALKNGSFALAFCDATNPKYAVFDATGAIVKAPSVVEAVANMSSYHIAALTGGGFVIGYAITGTFSFRYAVFDNLGAIVKAGSQIVAGTSVSNYSQTISVAALTGGGFVVSCATCQGASSTVQFGRYNAAGVLQGGVTIAVASSSTNGGFIRSIGLTGGGFAILANGTGIGSVATVWNAAGVQLGVTQTLAAAVLTYPNAIDVVALPNGNAAFVCSNIAGTDKAVTYINGTTGSVVASLTGAQITIPSGIGVAALSNGSIAIGAPDKIFTVDANCSLLANTPNPGMTPGTYNNFVVQQVTNPVRPTAVTFVLATSNASVWQTVINTLQQKCTPIGIFAASAAGGSSVPVQYVGNATLSTGFSQPFSLNAQGNNPPGQKMSILGNSVILQGIQSPAAQRTIS